MKELSIREVEEIIHKDENRVMEAKKTTGELVAGMIEPGGQKRECRV